MDFYERTKELVKQHNFSLIPFLQSLDLNYETYKSCKRAGNLPRADEAVRIAQALSTTVEYLVTGNAEAKRDNSESIELLKKVIENLS